MNRLQAIVIIAFCISLAFATPIQQTRKRSFKVERVAVPNYKPNGKAAYKRALLKFGFDNIAFRPGGKVAEAFQTASTAQLDQTGSGDNGDVTATASQNDAQFLSPVTVGGQQLVMNFDSGSSDMWVFNTANLDAASQKGHQNFDPTKSTTFSTLQGAQFNISYGDGSSASGPVGSDVVDIGGSTVEQQAFGVPNDVSASFVQNTAANGLVGLAFSKLNTVTPQQQKTFFDNVMADLSQPVFTAKLEHDSVGAYEFGVVDQTAFTGSLQTAAVDSSNGFWQVESASAAVNGQSISIAGGSAIMDTGTSLMLVTDDLLVGYWNNVQGAQLSDSAGGVIFPCNADLPDLQVAIGSNMATVSGTQMNFAEVGTDQTGTDFCFGGMQSNQGLQFSIYGDVFFKSNFVVFDGSAPSISVAPHS